MTRLLPLLLALGCHDVAPNDDKQIRDTTPVGDTAPHDTGSPEGDSGESDSTPKDTDTGTPCEDDADGDIPSDATWIVLDGLSTTLYSFDRTSFEPYVGYEDTYDLNAEVMNGGNGFKLDRPGTVVGVSVYWDHLPNRGKVAAPVTLWPDFGSDGYVFDQDNPYATLTRCLGKESRNVWVDYALPDPIYISEPLHVFAGYTRDPADPLRPDIYFEDTYQADEPYYSGARWPDVDALYNYGGLGSPWYTWQVRLAVVYDDEIPAEDKPFVEDTSLSVSSRVAWGDYDNDGDDDLMSVGPTLYQNDGHGNFTDVTATALPSGTNGSGGGVWGDYDNDGCLDYFGEGTGYTVGEELLHNNCDGTFTDVTVESGINDMQDVRDCNNDGEPEPSPTEGSAWFDLDNDGYLDLYMANYECPEYTDTTDPDYYGKYRDRLWRNNGDGTFTDYTDTMDIDPDLMAGRGATTGDVDQDGWTDLFISNYRLDPNFFYQNDEGTITDIAEANGTRGTFKPRYKTTFGHTIGSAFGDIDNDGDFDLISANLAHPFYYNYSDKTQLLINDGSGNFADEAADRGIYYRETDSNPSFFDADNDGDLDLFITDVYTGRDSGFYLNDGTGHFTLYNYEGGLLVRNGWGAATADVDNDGDEDVVAYTLFRNQGFGTTTHWLEVTAVGGMRGADTTLGVSNRSAIGATIQCTAGSLVQLRSVSGGSGTAVQDSLTQHFGLGDTDSVDEVRVLFPGGTVVSIEDPPVDSRLWVCEDGRSGNTVDTCE